MLPDGRESYEETVVRVARPHAHDQAGGQGGAAAVGILAGALHAEIETSQKHQQLRTAAEEVAREREGQLATLQARFAELKKEAGNFHAQAIAALVDLATKADEEKATVS